MELDDLKSGWQQAGDMNKTQTELQNMTKMKNHPALKKIRQKLVIEAALMTFLLFIYYDWFDGDRKSLLSNLLLAGSVLLIIINDVIGYVFLSQPATGTNLKTGVQRCLVRIKKLSLISVSLSLLYSISLLVFFSVSISFTTKKYFIEGGLIFILLLAVYFNYRVWLKWIRNLTSLSRDMENES